MAEIINLRRARKAKARAQSARQADANRARFGRTKTQKAIDAAEAERSTRRLDQHRLEPEDASD